jgi:uncharacterized protein (TIGR02001 family)
MKAGLFIASVVALCSAAPRASAQEANADGVTIAGSAGLASQYRFRGISLSDEDLAVQAGLTASHASGFYVGTWGSNLAGFGTFGGSNLELDLFGGYKMDLGGATLDAGLLWYLYPGTDGTDYAEPYVSIAGALGPASAKLGLAYAPEQEAIGDEDNWYVFGDLSGAVPGSRLTLKAHLGYSTGNSTLTPVGDYLDWLVGVDMTWKSLTFGVAYVDTDIGGADAAAAAFDRDIVDSAVLLTLSAAF